MSSVSASENNLKVRLNEQGAVSIIPKGHSMWPTLNNRAQSVIILPKTERLKPMDVGLYEKGDNYVLHRVMGVTDGGYIFCGDSQFNLEKVPEDLVFGVMQGFYVRKKFISVEDPKHIKKIKRYYRRKRIRKFRIRFFYFRLAVKHKLKSIFCKNGSEV